MAGNCTLSSNEMIADLTERQNDFRVIARFQLVILRINLKLRVPDGRLLRVWENAWIALKFARESAGAA